MLCLLSLAILATLAQSGFPHPPPGGYAPSYPVQYPQYPVVYRPPPPPPFPILPIYGGYYWDDWDDDWDDWDSSSSEERYRRRRHRDQRRRRRDDCGRLEKDCAGVDPTHCRLPDISYYWHGNIKKAYINCENYNVTQLWGVATTYNNIFLAVGAPARKFAICGKYGIWKTMNLYYNQTVEFKGVRCLEKAQLV
ncbi:hypothetical protein OESDEN_23973 [Oesophagostomum dentatum]|uniref:Uncharacterized protein n=1 Tax=Oesophagostomum dentatum TaxID=61180 RepID=A0A0B1RYW1_OESDE|nr:hypothetical protein OESDEN_23973 [Oesophagostomum dentatum]